MSHYDHNGTNLGDPRDTPDEKEIMRLLKRITSLTTELAAVKAERNAVIEECAKHIENRDEAFGNTFADEIRELLTKDKP